METNAIRAARALAEMIRAIRMTGDNVSRALILIELHKAGDRGWQLAALSSHLRQDKQTVRRWLRNLIGVGHVDRQDHRYRLTEDGVGYIEDRTAIWLEACQPEARQALYRVARPRRR